MPRVAYYQGCRVEFCLLKNKKLGWCAEILWEGKKKEVPVKEVQFIYEPDVTSFVTQIADTCRQELSQYIEGLAQRDGANIAPEKFFYWRGVRVFTTGACRAQDGEAYIEVTTVDGEPFEVHGSELMNYKGFLQSIIDSCEEVVSSQNPPPTKIDTTVLWMGVVHAVVARMNDGLLQIKGPDGFLKEVHERDTIPST